MGTISGARCNPDVRSVMEFPLSLNFPGVRGRPCVNAILAGSLLLVACEGLGRQPAPPATSMGVADTAPEPSPASRRAARRTDEPRERDYPSAADVANGPAGMPQRAPADPVVSGPPPKSVPPRLDLENLVTAQEQHFANNNRYASNLSTLTLRLVPRSGVTVRIESASDSGWTGSSVMESWPGSSCVVWVGRVAERPATDRHRLTAARSGQVACDSL